MLILDITKLQPKHNVVWTSCVCWEHTSSGERHARVHQKVRGGALDGGS